jgi:hypothetical protein
MSHEKALDIFLEPFFMAISTVLKEIIVLRENKYRVSNIRGKY